MLVCWMLASFYLDKQASMLRAYLFTVLSALHLATIVTAEEKRSYLFLLAPLFHRFDIPFQITHKPKEFVHSYKK
jgi:hypothetical protein